MDHTHTHVCMCERETPLTVFSAIRHAASLLPEHRPDRREHFVSRRQRTAGGRAAIARPRSPPRVRPAACKVSSAPLPVRRSGVTARTRSLAAGATPDTTCATLSVERFEGNVSLTVFTVLSCSPICYSWEGGKLLAHSPDYDEIVVTREDYEENGHCICEEKFDIWLNWNS